MAQWQFLADWKQTATATAETGKLGLIQQLKQAVESERREMLVGHVRSQVAEVLGFSSALDVDLTKGFFDLGIDSLTAVELRNRLQKNLSCNLPSTLTFKYPTTDALVDYLFELLLGLEIDEEQTVKPKEPKEVQITSQSNIEDLSDDETEKSLLNVLDKLGY